MKSLGEGSTNKLDFETNNGETIIPKFLKHFYQYPHFYAKCAGLRNEAVFPLKSCINTEIAFDFTPGNPLAKCCETSDVFIKQSQNSSAQSPAESAVSVNSSR